jgi:hypothetical protein
MLEKRTHSRMPVKLPIQYRLLDNPEQVEKFKGKVALAKDLSMEGMFLKIAPDRALRTGEVVRLDISLPEISKHLFAFGEVVWINRLGAGIHLMLMPDEDRQYLKSYLDQLTYS